MNLLPAKFFFFNQLKAIKMKNVLILFVVMFSFVSCEKEPMVDPNNWIAEQLIGTKYIVHNTNVVPGVATSIVSFDETQMTEQILLDETTWNPGTKSFGSWGVIYKNGWTVGIWTDTELLGYREWSEDFSGQDLILIDRTNGEKYILERI